MSAALAEGPVCPHCGGGLGRWTPPDSSTWTGEQRICLNDDCPYYKKGWVWMRDQYGVHASYRYRLDPETGASGSLPVNSPHALKDIAVPPEETS
mgnify:CR=1 FL=1